MYVISILNLLRMRMLLQNSCFSCYLPNILRGVPLTTLSLTLLTELVDTFYVSFPTDVQGKEGRFHIGASNSWQEHHPCLAIKAPLRQGLLHALNWPLQTIKGISLRTDIMSTQCKHPVKNTTNPFVSCIRSSSSTTRKVQDMMQAN